MSEVLRIRRRIGIGLIVAAAGIAAWVWQARAPLAPSTPVAAAPQPFVQLAGAGSAARNQVLEERAELMDPTPLFYPTSWNYGASVALREGRLREPTQVFTSFDPKLTVPEQGLAPYEAGTTVVPQKLSDLLVQNNEAPFAGMGQLDLQRSILPVRSGFLEVRALGNSEVIIEQSLTGIQPPRQDFPPLEFLIVVESIGLVSSPILVAGSGWDEVDAFFRAYLTKSYHLGERLPPGRYRVVVGA